MRDILKQVSITMSPFCFIDFYFKLLIILVDPPKTVLDIDYLRRDLTVSISVNL